MFVSTMTGGCGLLDWQTNMQITHAVASAPLGPFQRQQRGFLPTFSTNPQVVVDGDELWMFHIGSAWGNSTGKNCSNASSSTDRRRQQPSEPSPPPPPRLVVHRAKSPFGPWQPVILDVNCNNPAPFRGSDGIYRLMCDWHMYTSTQGFGKGWGRPILVPGIASDQNGDAGPGDRLRRGARMEDPFLYQDKRGHYHVLAHTFGRLACGKINDPASVSPSCNWISGHAFSR
jgi:hypothetical protein